jgi:hypothetical protein
MLGLTENQLAPASTLLNSPVLLPALNRACVLGINRQGVNKAIKRSDAGPFVVARPGLRNDR